MDTFDWSREQPDSTPPNELTPVEPQLFMGRTAMKCTHHPILQFAATAALSLLFVHTGYAATLVRTASSSGVIPHPALPTGYTTVPFATTSISTHVSYSGTTNTFGSSTIAGSHTHAYTFFIGPYQLTGNVNQSGPANQSHAHQFDSAANQVFGPNRGSYFGTRTLRFRSHLSRQHPHSDMPTHFSSGNGFHDNGTLQPGGHCVSTD